MHERPLSGVNIELFQIHLRETARYLATLNHIESIPQLKISSSPLKPNELATFTIQSTPPITIDVDDAPFWSDNVARLLEATGDHGFSALQLVDIYENHEWKDGQIQSLMDGQCEVMISERDDSVLLPLSSPRLQLWDTHINQKKKRFNINTSGSLPR
ncbi:unnamed protein product [Sphagnum jensenii]|uniref:Uncharacterized protein n=2 Tax=Sphagnum jensenii TaxID=128206 RepID=A0ABP0VHQ4_9BRYO